MTVIGPATAMLEMLAKTHHAATGRRNERHADVSERGAIKCLTF